MTETRGAIPAVREASSETSVEDGFLVASVLSGDSMALRQLLVRYDRLVRYVVFQASQRRCHDDPQWLDSVASATWAGFVQSLNRSPDDLPTNLPGYLARIARNQTISAMRGKGLKAESLDAVGGDGDDIAGGTASDSLDPLEMLAQVEDLESLRRCLADVGDEDRPLLGQLEAITSRRWKVAAMALGLAESTLRSRWGRLLDRLRACMAEKDARNLAPGAADCD